MWPTHIGSNFDKHKFYLLNVFLSIFICRYVAILHKFYTLEQTFICRGASMDAKVSGSVNRMTPSDENMFRVSGHLGGETIGNRWIPLTNTSDLELWCFLWSLPEQTVEQTIETPGIIDAIPLNITSL